MKIYRFSLTYKLPNETSKYQTGYVFGENEKDANNKLKEEYQPDCVKIETIKETYVIEN